METEMPQPVSPGERLVRQQLLEMLGQELLFQRQPDPRPSSPDVSLDLTHVLNVPEEQQPQKRCESQGLEKTSGLQLSAQESSFTLT